MDRCASRMRVTWHSVWIGLMALPLFLVTVYTTQTSLREPPASGPLVGWDGDRIHIVGYGSRPVVVTHLISHGPKGEPRATAALPYPVVLFESGEHVLSAQAVRSLAWRDGDGNATPTPELAYVRALYHRPEETAPNP